VHARFRCALNFLASEQVPVKEISLTQADDGGAPVMASFVVSAGQVYGWTAIRAALEQALEGEIHIDDGLAAVSLIGEGLNRDNRTLLETLALMARHDIAVAGVMTTSFRISLLVPRERIDESVQHAHARWVAGTAGLV
jgi:aspartate kinase